MGYDNPNCIVAKVGISHFTRLMKDTSPTAPVHACQSLSIPVTMVMDCVVAVNIGIALLGTLHFYIYLGTEGETYNEIRMYEYNTGDFCILLFVYVVQGISAS